MSDVYIYGIVSDNEDKILLNKDLDEFIDGGFVIDLSKIDNRIKFIRVEMEW